MATNFVEKSIKCGEALKWWASQKFGNIGRNKKELMENLKKLQTKEMNEQFANEMCNVGNELDHVLNLGKMRWYQRS